MASSSSALLALAIAVGGLVASFFIPHAPSAAPDLRIGFNIVSDSWRMVRHVAARRGIFLSILGISWFWLLGATFLAQFPAFAKNVLGGNDHVVTLFLTAFSIGIGIGSMLCNRLLKGVISVRYVPAAALAMTVFILDLYFATRHLPADERDAPRPVDLSCTSPRPGMSSSTCCCCPWPAASLSCRSTP